MNKALAILFVFFVAFCSKVKAAERITALITVTNPPVTSNSLTINSTFRYWTNSSSLGTIATNLTGKNAAATNLYNQIASYPYAGGVVLQWADTNAIRLIGPLGGALSGSLSGTWGTIALSTQSGPQTYTALWPMESIVGTTNRTNQGSALVSGLSTYSTNAFATNATALSNYITKGASPPQSIASELRVAGNINNGAASLSVSNLANFGNAIRSFGTGGNSFQAGSNATASASRSVALGNSSVASGTDALAAGTSAQATNLNATAVGVSTVANQNSAAFGTTAIAEGNSSTSIGASSQATAAGASAIGNLTQATGAGSFAAGQSATATAPYAIAIGNEDTDASGTNAVAIGLAAQASEYRSTALGAGSVAQHKFSTAIGGYDNGGTATTTTETNQIRIGTTSHAISIPGIVDSPTITNSTFRGTNIINGRLDATPRSNSSLANGYNSGVIFGTNLWVEFSGPSGAYTNVGFAAPGGPQIVWGQFDNPGLSFTLLNESGLEATAANRITTDTGALLNSTNRTVFVGFKYDTATSRWRVISFR